MASKAAKISAAIFFCIIFIFVFIVIAAVEFIKGCYDKPGGSKMRVLKNKAIKITPSSRHNYDTVFKGCDIVFTFEPFVYYVPGSSTKRLELFELTEQGRAVFNNCRVIFDNCTIATPSNLSAGASIDGLELFARRVKRLAGAIAAKLASIFLSRR